MRRHPVRYATQGFTLAEVLFAMGIFSFAALALVGTLPNGMASMQSARLQAAESRIFQHLRRIYQSDLDRLAPDQAESILNGLQESQVFYFDDRGEPLRALAAIGNDAHFGALTVLLPAHPLPGESDPSPFLWQLRVIVSQHWRRDDAYFTPALHRLRTLPITLTGPIISLTTEPASDDPTPSPDPAPPGGS